MIIDEEDVEEARQVTTAGCVQLPSSHWRREHVLLRPLTAPPRGLALDTGTIMHDTQTHSRLATAAYSSPTCG